jgi:hypothetical protein
MIHRFLDRLEQSPISPYQVLLVFLAFIFIRLQAEVLFLDADRATDFFVFNIWYFFSLLLCLVLLSATLTKRSPQRVLRVMTPFSAVILMPLLDRFFYPHLNASQLLDLCRLPLYPKWQFYAQDLLTRVIEHRLFFTSRLSLGLRIEVLSAALGVGIYVFSRTHGRIAAVVKALVAYLVCICVIYVHGVLVVHPATRRWIFPPLVLAELLILLAIWYRTRLVACLRSYAWVETFVLLGAMAIGFSQHPAFANLMVPQVGKLVAGGTALLFLGLFIGGARNYARSAPPGVPDPWLRLPCTFGCLGCMLASLPANPGFFLSLAMLAGLVYLIWLSPFRLATHAPLYSVMAALALWVMTWAGYSCGQLTSTDSPMAPPPPPGSDRPGFSAGSFPNPPPPPPDMLGSGRLGTPLLLLHNLLGFGPPQGPGGPGSNSPFDGPGPQPGFAVTLHPIWLFHPIWLATPVLIYGLTLATRRQRKNSALRLGLD